MWTITDLKKRGRAAFTANYWICVIAALILGICLSGSGSNGRNNNTNVNVNDHELNFSTGNVYSELEELSEQGANYVAPFMGLAFAFGGLLAIIVAFVAVVVKICIFNALEVGGRRFFLVNLYEKAKIKEFGFAFSNGWANVVVTLFLRDLKIFLWTLLFIMPGIIKSYEYRMIPYLLAENPEMSSQEAFERSKEMMNGEKMATFVLDLSFIGWTILSAFTLGLTGLFWSEPYAYSTYAAQYDFFRTIERNRDMYMNNFQGNPQGPVSQ